MWLREIAETLHAEFGHSNYDIETQEMGTFYLKLASFFSDEAA